MAVGPVEAADAAETRRTGLQAAIIGRFSRGPNVSPGDVAVLLITPAIINYSQMALLKT